MELWLCDLEGSASAFSGGDAREPGELASEGQIGVSVIASLKLERGRFIGSDKADPFKWSPSFSTESLGEREVSPIELGVCRLIEDGNA